MAVAKHGRESGCLDPLGEEERTARLGVREKAARESHRFQQWSHFIVKIPCELACALRALTFRWDGNAAREIGPERAAVEIMRCARDGGFSAHAGILGVCKIAWQDS